MKFFRFSRNTGDIEILSDRPRRRLPSQCTGELIRLIAAQLGLPRGEVDAVVKCLLVQATKSLKSGQAVVFAGFGRFRPRKCRSGKSRHPATGKVLPVLRCVNLPQRQTIEFT